MPCCPFCTRDISFMAPAFGELPASSAGFYQAPKDATLVGSLVPVAAPAEVRLDDVVYTRDLQSLLWTRMQEKAALWSGMNEEGLIRSTCEQRRKNRDDGSTVLHLMFDKNVTPRGNIIHRAVLSTTATVSSQPSYDEAALVTMGYSVVDHKIQVVDDTPVGPIWNALQYWGGERQHKRWHMGRPINANPRRNDCPAFMDARMCAVQVWFEDDLRLHEGLAELLRVCREGINGSPAPGVIQAMMLG